MSNTEPRLLIVDMAVANGSPAGSCVLAEVEGLASRFHVTVLSGSFDGQAAGIEYQRVPLMRAPILLRYISFQLNVMLAYWRWRMAGGRAWCVQATQGQLPWADVSYAHFCHRAYLKNQWQDSTVSGLRRFARWANHRFNAFFEARAFQRCRRLVVPSHGLARELSAEYPEVRDKVFVLPNPVAIERFRRPEAFDRAAKRAELGLLSEHLVLGFMALGDFSRKGLGLLVEALGRVPPAQRLDLRILIIGGQPGEIAEFQGMAQRLGVGEALVFVGMQSDVRPFLWCADVFAFPSAYEIFSLAILQAAAAGLPVLVSEGLYGAEEFIVHGENGWVVPRKVEALLPWLTTLPEQRERLPDLSARAEASVSRYSREAFAQRWCDLYAELAQERRA